MSDRVPEGFSEIVINYQVPGSAGAVQCAFGVDSAVAPGDAALHAGIEDCVGNLTGILSDQVVSNGYTVIVGESAGDLVYDHAFVAQGSRSSDNCPANTSALLQKRCAVGGRRNRGRFYLPCPSGDDVENTGNFDSTAMPLFETYASDALTTLQAAGLEMVILHQVAPFTPSVVTTLLPQQKVATQRGRLR